MNDQKPSYTPSPEVPKELMPRLAAVVEVLAGMKTVSQVARELGLSRNHFQSILHRSLLAMVKSISPKAAGRPAKPEDLSELQQRLKKLERENGRLKKRVDATDKLLEVAGQLLHGRTPAGMRQRRTRKKTEGGSEAASESEPEERHAHILDAVDEMHRLGLTRSRAARLTGYDVSTLRRWRCCPVRGPSRSQTVAPSVRQHAEQAVRELHGLVGAAALSHSVAGLSRRAAARIKQRILTAMEQERQDALAHVRITLPGVLRGMDAMHLTTNKGARYALIAADGAVPYRTHVTLGEHYDAAHVARTLREDLDRNGAPLVLRADRARAHDSPEVRAVLQAHGVLMLHGPPRYPCFYGQLERQNREHRAWLEAIIDPLGATLQQLLQQMLHCLNSLWPRRSLRWQTAAQVWNARPPLTVDRCTFQQEVHDRARHIERHLNRRGEPADLAERLAIEQTLTHMGYLHQQIGARC